jgi:hypothetical protein
LVKRKHTAVDGLELALCFTFVLDTNGAASAGRVGGHYGGFCLEFEIKGWNVFVVWRFGNRSNGFFYGTTL